MQLFLMFPLKELDKSETFFRVNLQNWLKTYKSKLIFKGLKITIISQIVWINLKWNMASYYSLLGGSLIGDIVSDVICLLIGMMSPRMWQYILGIFWEVTTMWTLELWWHTAFMAIVANHIGVFRVAVLTTGTEKFFCVCSVTPHSEWVQTFQPL